MTDIEELQDSLEHYVKMLLQKSARRLAFIYMKGLESEYALFEDAFDQDERNKKMFKEKINE